MTQYRYSAHALARLRQRGRREDDIDLIVHFGTPVIGDGIVLLEADVAQSIRHLRALSNRLQRLRNWKVVLAGDDVITVYRTDRRHQKHLLRD